MKGPVRTNQKLIEENAFLKQRIQEMVQAEEALQCERDNLANILNVMNDGVYIVDQQYDIQFVNTVLKNAFGPWQDMKCYAYFHNRTEVCSWCPNQKVFAGETVRWEWYSERDGKTYDLIDTPMKGSDGRILKLEIFRDITKRKQAEEALRASTENFRRSLDESPLGVRIVTAEGETIYANRAILDIHGYNSIEDLRTTPVKKRYAPESYAEFKIRREKRKRGDYDPSEYEISIIRKDGEVRNLQVFRKEVLWGGDRQFQVIYQDITERKRAEKALRLITDNMSDMIRVTDLQGINLYSSPSHEKVLGYKPGDRIGKSVFDIVHPDDLEHIINVFSAGLVNKKPAKVEYRVKHAEGHYVWLETIGDLIRDDHGEVTAVIMSSRDISERKQAEEEIRHGNMLLSAIIENIPNTIFLKDAKELRFILLNRAGEDLTGYSRDVLRGKNDYDFVPKEQAAFFMEKDREVLRGMGVVDIPEEPLQTRYRGIRTLHTKKVPIQNANGEPEYLLGISEDITERKQAEETLRENEEKYCVLFEGINDAVFVHDLDEEGHPGRFLQVNDVACRRLGYTREELLSLRPRDITMPEEYERIADKRIGLASQGDILAETIHVTKDGRKIPVESHIRQFQYLGKQVALSISRDITERKQTEADKEKLETQNRQLQKAESLGRMAGAIAHTFNNQLGVVIGNLEMALMDLSQGAKPVNSLTTAMQAAGKSADVSCLMLTYLGQTPGKREPLDLSDVCLQNLPLLRTAIPNNVVLEADLSTPGPAISANANQIQQVLTNLLTNAWEAVGEDGGSIHLRVKAVSLTEIPIVHRNPIDWQPQDNAYACLEVADTGCGIADKDIEKIFDPFFSSKFTGRGMGLAIVMGIVRAHGGAITVESEPGRGSAFRIFFPVSGEEVFRQPDKAAQPLATEVGGTVLLVEDEEMVRNMAAAMLNRLGFSVLEAKDGVEAVELFRQRQDEIRCVLTDLTMPRMNGWETLTALRKLAPNIPVILASGYDKAHVMAGDHPELPQVFLGKPYKLKELSNAIGQALVSRK